MENKSSIKSQDKGEDANLSLVAPEAPSLYRPGGHTAVQVNPNGPAPPECLST